MIGCNVFINYIPNHLDIEQGILLTTQDIQKIHIGMTKTDIFSCIGTPILQDLFELNTWFYIYYHYYVDGQFKSQTIKLIFDSNDMLINMNNL